jgi:trehalose 6-phosphate synthase/phosphatase
VRIFFNHEESAGLSAGLVRGGQSTREGASEIVIPQENAQSIREELAGKKLIVVSNREPYIHKRTGLNVKVEQPAGGLTSALDDVLKAVQGTWVAWGNGNADRDAVDMQSRVAVPPEDPRYTLKRVWIKPQEVDNYYHGYANQVLWPLCHVTLDRVAYRKNFWYYYERVNQAFAEAVLEEADDRSIVWFHDYHLCLAPRLLRGQAPGLTLAHFWHIPWPDWSVFRVCPQAREILEGLLANDLIGFQIPLFVKNFMDCVRECLEADIDSQRRTITYREHTTRLDAFPISVDYSKFHALAASAHAARAIENIRQYHRLHGLLVGIGVDRLEYTKALIKRLQAIELFFERYASFRRKFTFIQIAVSTRMREPYLSYSKTVVEMIERINKRFSQSAWKPIIYVTTKIDHHDLALYYRLSDLAIISSVYDGMNLVAKEYVASQVDGQGVLVLSEFAGAAEELEGSLLVNPYNVEEFSDIIKQALTMHADEKRARMRLLRRQVSEHDIHSWTRDVIGAARVIHKLKQRECCSWIDSADELRMRLGNREVFLFLDFDGTLAPIVDSPEKALLPAPIRSSLERLLRIVQLAVVSGRALDDLKSRVGLAGIVYAGNHGSEIWIEGSVLHANGVDNTTRTLRTFLDRLRTRLSRVEGVLIEDKGITASIHFRQVDPSHVGDVLRIFWDIARDYEKVFRITTGKKVMELRPQAAWNKGQAVARIMELKGRGMLPIYVGDDTTDEDAFRAIKGSGISVSIGANAESDYYLRDQEEMGAFLDWIADILAHRCSRDSNHMPAGLGRESDITS